MADVKSLLERATAAQRRGETAAATAAYEAVLAASPENPHALNALGMMALSRKDYPDAEGRFHRAALADGKEPALWLNVATAQRGRGDDAGELASLKAALALDRRHFMALLRKAELHERRDEGGLAAEAWNGVVLLAAQAGELPPQIAEAVAHGRGFLEAHGAKLGAVLDAALEDQRAKLDARERRRFEAAVDAMLGKRRIYANQCHGAHFPFLPADEFFDRDAFPWMAALEARTPAIRDELRALIASGDAPLQPYVAQEPGTPESKWTPLDHSLDWGAMFFWEYGVRNEPLCARCPETVKALEAVPQSDIPNRAPTAFFSLLRPRTHIPPHTGVTNVRTIVHLPLIVPEGCRFRVGGETRAWREGEAFAFDDTIEHEAWNDSDQLRAVLIFDVWNPWLTGAECALLRTMFAASDESGLGPERREGARF